MLWFEGSVAEAVNLSKQRNAIFVVFVEGDNEMSQELQRVITSETIAGKLQDQSNFLIVKITSGSENYTHFARIYQFVPVPSLFFLGQNGTPLEVVCAGVEEHSLSSRIDKILEEHRKTTPSLKLTPSSSNTATEQSRDLIRSEIAASAREPIKSTEMPSTSSQSVKIQNTARDDGGPASKLAKTEHSSGGQEYDVVCEGDVCVRVPKKNGDKTDSDPQQPPPPVGENAMSVEERVEHARLLLEAKKAEKARLEKEAEKARELERRARGQGVAELKRWQQDQEMKQLLEARRRDKQQSEEARARVLSQIAQDRAESRARAFLDNDVATPQDVANNSTPAPTAVPNGTQARIVFKLPDGSSHAAVFNVDDTLATLRQYVVDSLHMPENTFSLWTAFPRRELVDNDASLVSLSLAPSAAVLVLPSGRQGEVRQSGRHVAAYSFISTLLTTLIIDPSYRLWGWIQTVIFQRQPQNNQRAQTPPPNPIRPSTVRQRTGTNIHRLTGDDNGEDNNTWNGNSTQQM